MAPCECNDPFNPGDEKRIGLDEQRSGSCLDRTRKRGVGPPSSQALSQKQGPFLPCLNGRGEAFLRVASIVIDDYSQQTMSLLCHAVIKNLPAFMT